MDYVSVFKSQIKSEYPIVSHPVYKIYQKWLPLLCFAMVALMCGKELYGKLKTFSVHFSIIIYYNTLVLIVI